MKVNTNPYNAVSSIYLLHYYRNLTFVYLLGYLTSKTHFTSLVRKFFDHPLMQKSILKKYCISSQVRISQKKKRKIFSKTNTL